MILTRTERAKAYQDRGIYGSQTLQMVFARLAAEESHRVAFTEIGGDGTVREMSRSTAHRQVEALAALLSTIGLKADQSIGIYMPNTIEAYIAALAAWRAGLIVVPLPVAWSDEEISAAITAASIRAVITVGEADGQKLAETIREIATESFSIRFLLGFGANLPDGVMSVDAALADPELIGLAPELHRSGNAADHIAMIGWAKPAETPAPEQLRAELQAPSSPVPVLVPVPWSHNQLIVTGLAHMLEAGIESHARLFNSFEPSGLPAFAGGLVTTILAGGVLICHQVTSLDALTDALALAQATHALLPSAVGRFVADARALTVHPKLSLVTRDLDRASGEIDGVAVTDLYLAEGIALVPMRRQNGLETRLKTGAHLVPSNSTKGIALTEIRLNVRTKGRAAFAGAAATVYLRGPCVPDAPWPNTAASQALLGAAERDGFVSTGWRAKEPPLGEDNLLAAAEEPDALLIGGERFDLAQVTRVFSALPGVRGAVPIMTEDDNGGQRLGVSVILDGTTKLDMAAWATYFDQCDWPEVLRPKVIKTVRLLPAATPTDGTPKPPEPHRAAPLRERTPSEWLQSPEMAHG